MSKVCFAILHYGDIEPTKICIESILNMNEKNDIEIVLIDNDTNKDDKQRAVLKNTYKDIKNVHLLKMDGSTGFSRANNIGYKYAIDNFDPDFIVVCNNDVEFKQKNTIELINQIYNETNFAVLGPDIIKKSNNVHQNPHDPKVCTKEEMTHSIKMNTLFLKHYNLLYPILYLYFKKQEKNIEKMDRENKKHYDRQQENIVLTGSCLIFSKDYIKLREKCFYPETQFYCEEHILAYQCNKLNLKMVYSPKLWIYHESELSTKKSFDSEKKSLKFRLTKTIESSKIFLKMLDENVKENK